MSVGLEIYPYVKGKQSFKSRLKLDLYKLMNLQELFFPSVRVKMSVAPA